ncbi:MAG: uracil-DNA glycosylase [Thermoanaerobaculia bacterium]|jgi:uracil-DNA glycosylase|nr:uracil-DNA glycosylase [Thermoanaerobaculia bacterium]
MVQHAAFAQHVATLTACAACPNVFGRPVVGAVADARVMLVGQAPGPHEVDARRPFAYTAGKRLFSWMAGLGVDEETFRQRVQISAVIRCFPGKDASGGDRVPDVDEIARCGAHLDREIAILKPKLVMAVGTLASQQLIGIAQLKDAVGRIHRAKRAGQAFDVIVLPHPSGRSTWLNKAENLVLLNESLRLIAAHPAFGRSFR